MIESITRKDYYYKTIFIFVAITLVSGALLINSSASVSAFIAWPMALLIALLIFLAFLMVEKETRQRKVVIKKDEILIYNLLTQKPISLKTSDVIGFETKKQKLYSRSGVPINDGFRVTSFVLTQQRTFIISEDQYENYSEIVNSIVSKLNK